MKEYFDRYLEALREIISLPSVQGEAAENAPFGAAAAKCLERTLEICEELGFSTRNNGNYYGYCEAGEGELFGILGHLDTVPYGNGWKVPPTSAQIVDGRLYGRGVLDDKGPILACVYAIKQLLDEGLRPNKRIRVIFGCNEESGWKCIDKYTECEEMPVQGFSPDGDFPVINCEKGIVYYEVRMPLPEHMLSIEGGDRPNMVLDRASVRLDRVNDRLIDYCNKRSLEINGRDVFTVTSRGKSAHGSTPSAGKNALFGLLDALSYAFGGKYDELKEKLSSTDGSSYGLALSDEASGHLTINIGKVFSDKRNWGFSLDIRYPISYDKAFICDRLRALFPDADIKETMCHPSLYISPDHPLVKTLLGAYNAVTGENGKPITIGGGTYARALETGVAFGPIFPNSASTIHQPNESADIAELEKMYEIYVKAIHDLCFEK